MTLWRLTNTHTLNDSSFFFSSIYSLLWNPGAAAEIDFHSVLRTWNSTDRANCGFGGPLKKENEERFVQKWFTAAERKPPKVGDHLEACMRFSPHPWPGHWILETLSQLNKLTSALLLHIFKIITHCYNWRGAGYISYICKETIIYASLFCQFIPNILILPFASMELLIKMSKDKFLIPCLEWFISFTAIPTCWPRKY